VALNVPDALKADLPEGLQGKLLSATPVVMTVVATLLAGLSSSEMTRAQYDRSLAAQLQSKAGDQWSFFQAKRLRGAMQRSTIDLMFASTELRPLELAALRAALTGSPAGTALESPAGQQALRALTAGEMPVPAAKAALAPALADALGALEHAQPETELLPLLGKIDDADLEQAVRDARAAALAFDAATGPITNVIDQIEKHLAGSAAGSVRREFITARLGYSASRYDHEARLNQSVASLYELQVRKGNLSAERHHRRSQKFFYGMLAAQVGVVVSTLAMAARKRNLLWSLAAAAGTAAIAFAVYVYLYV